MEVGKKKHSTQIRSYAAGDASTFTTRNNNEGVNFSLPAPTGYKDDDEDIWYDCTVWFYDSPKGKYAFETAESIRKGDLVEVSGHLRNVDIVEDKDGNPRAYQKFMVDSIVILERKEDRPQRDNSGGSSRGGGSSRSGGSSRGGGSSRSGGGSRGGGGRGREPMDDSPPPPPGMDDDVPF